MNNKKKAYYFRHTYYITSNLPATVELQVTQSVKLTLQGIGEAKLYFLQILWNVRIKLQEVPIFFLDESDYWTLKY